jgi:hypothetical protein
MKKPYDPATEKPYFIDEEGARNYDYDNTIRYLQHKGRLKFLSVPQELLQLSFTRKVIKHCRSIPTTQKSIVSTIWAWNKT